MRAIKEDADNEVDDGDSGVNGNIDDGQNWFYDINDVEKASRRYDLNVNKESILTLHMLWVVCYDLLCCQSIIIMLRR